MMSFKLYSSPLQGFTDYRFRTAFNKYFGGIDTFYAPYFRLNGKLAIKSSYAKDVLPENNLGIKLIPQIITNDTKEFLYVADYVKQLGYKELNWNLGCPYPMVTKCGMGSGLISESEKINSILEEVHQKSDIIVSMKMRLGYENSSEILNLLPVLNKFPLKNIAIHARLGKQLYKGGVDLDAFEKCINVTKHTLYYNGDITSLTKFKELQARFPTINNWMIGRGIISNPFLPNMIKNNNSTTPENWIESFRKFHDLLFEGYSDSLQGKSHLLIKMYHLWEYFIVSFPNSPKGLKTIKKASSIKNYLHAVDNIFRNEA